MRATPVHASLAATLLLAAIPRAASGGTFADDTAFLKAHQETIVLSDATGSARLAVVPALQGRVMTSSSGGDAGQSYGWINRELIASGKVLPHMNAFGGEDRFWMGPEGGQFSVFFEKGKAFELSNWFTPAIFDTLPFEVVSHSRGSAVFGARFALTNYSGTTFEVGVKRTVRVLETADSWSELGTGPVPAVGLVAYATDNQITNAGSRAWSKDTGLLSVWILGQYNPSPSTTIIVPIRTGPESALGPRVTADYFGAIPADRISATENAVFLAADGRFRSKIGISPRRSRAVLGSYDAAGRVLTIVRFNQPVDATDYVNSLWKLQDNPFGGDAANAYNDGPATPGAKPMGPFYELESSSPAAALAPGGSLTHTRLTFHLSGPRAALDAVARRVLGVSIDEIEGALARR